jgi:hypothetical protein
MNTFSPVAVEAAGALEDDAELLFEPFEHAATAIVAIATRRSVLEKLMAEPSTLAGRPLTRPVAVGLERACGGVAPCGVGLPDEFCATSSGGHSMRLIQSCIRTTSISLRLKEQIHEVVF